MMFLSIQHTQNFIISAQIIYTVVVLITEIKYKALWPGKQVDQMQIFHSPSALPNPIPLISLPALQQTTCYSLFSPPLPPFPMDLTDLHLLISCTPLIALSQSQLHQAFPRTHRSLWPEKEVSYLQIFTYPSSLLSPIPQPHAHLCSRPPAAPLLTLSPSQD